MIVLGKLLAAIVLNVTSGRVAVTPIDDYLDTVVMDMECDVAPDCAITIPADADDLHVMVWTVRR